MPKGIDDGFFLVFGAHTWIPFTVPFLTVGFMHLYSILCPDLCQIESVNIEPILFFDIVQNNSVCRNNSSRIIQDFSINRNANSTLSVFAP